MVKIPPGSKINSKEIKRKNKKFSSTVRIEPATPGLRVGCFAPGLRYNKCRRITNDSNFVLNRKLALYPCCLNVILPCESAEGTQILKILKLKNEANVIATDLQLIPCHFEMGI